MAKPLTKAEIDWIQHAEHNARFGWAALSCRSHPKRVAMGLIARGFLEDVGLTVVVDGGGFTKEPERWRIGYKLTEAGKAEGERIQREEKARLDDLFRSAA